MKGPDKRQQLNEDGNNPPTKPQSSVSKINRITAERTVASNGTAFAIC